MSTLPFQISAAIEVVLILILLTIVMFTRSDAYALMGRDEKTVNELMLRFFGWVAIGILCLTGAIADLLMFSNFLKTF